ncbi:RecQ family ATP-dependent DNA helicase [Halomonas sp. GXIMD04776]|uniref:RecQ family ATP-dependent DNA helicase n=1 Tax=Halomonas sp. GXIMD04776 TaxID=3415605 RepID=UPI003CAF491D
MVPCSWQKGLIFDLEVTPEKPGRPAQIFKLGALRIDTGDTLELDTGKDVEGALRQLDELATGAEFLLGHNVFEHDLPILRQVAPSLDLLALPALDTLRLSPLAFPQNPYHRLIKDYKLIRDSLNSPLADCRSTLTLFGDQQTALRRLGQTHQDELLCYQALVGNSGAWGSLFSALSGQATPSVDAVGLLLPKLLRETDPTLSRDLKVCRSRLARLIDNDLAQVELHWPLAYVLAWLRVSGGNSVLAPWVRHQFPEVSRLIHELRDTPCGNSACEYCCTVHDPRHELKRYFGFEDFRREPEGDSPQHDITLAGMRDESVLAVLATGGGKSVCYQLPALNRYHRNGSLTILISPLQSLMKDQVDGLLERNISCSAALNGLLTMPERAEVLEKIQLGDVGILLVSPEQFRNKAFRRAIENRQISAWIFDEAHCLSKWGNDFRPDYLYAARFIREFTGQATQAPIGCFTATAKQDVLDDIREHFREELGTAFKEFLGKPDRVNLEFDVLPVTPGEKWPCIQQLLEQALTDREGGAVVFVASRSKAEQLAEFLAHQDWACRYFHAGLQPHEKKDIQDAFKAGTLRLIVATNAFGMGVDKPDVRLVIHADIPGSLENYLQEAGRAGRDQQQARCVLLYDPQDIETQFGLSERAKLSLRDIQQILRKVRLESQQRQTQRLVITAGEILQDEQVTTSFEIEDSNAETKVVTAIAWLERGDFLRREENHTRIFPARLTLAREEAELRLNKAKLSQRRREEFLVILRYLYEAEADERINTDHLMSLTGRSSEEVSAALRQLEQLNLLENDTQLTIYLRHKVAGHARARLDKTLSLEKALIDELREQAPDADQGGWQDIALVALTARLRDRTDRQDLLPLHLLQLLRSLAKDRDGDSQQRSSIELRQINRDYLKLRIRGGYTWWQVQKLGEKRRDLAGVVMPFLVGKLPDDARGKDLLVRTTFGELLQLIDKDLHLNATIKPDQRRRSLEHVLLYLHQQEVLTLNHGMTVMRRAMTLEINREKQQNYLKKDYQRLDEHYREKRIQVHVMREYAEVALKEISRALELVRHYFEETKQDFLRHYFAGKTSVLKLATSEASWHAIVGGLNDTQKAIVTDEEDGNRLILAGPGSGKTRVVVHRVAYLLRVRRIPASSIIALTFNRHAANEIRQRLLELVGNEAYGLTVLTYHAMAMRLTGVSFTRRDTIAKDELDGLLEEAAALLEGKRILDGEDDLRERLLRGYRYILVDEYQDIDERQYHLVSSLAKRHSDNDQALCILAVGDDDQNIYQWRGGNNRYIEQFREEYQASTSYLIENYRSSKAIIEAANHLIECNPARMKARQPVRVDARREELSATGRWQNLDNQRKGRVLCLTLPPEDSASGNLQAQAALGELRRLLALEGRDDWQDCAVLARTHRCLWPLQAWCEREHVDYFLAADKQGTAPLTRQREFLDVVRCLGAGDEATLELVQLPGMLKSLSLDGSWRCFFETAFAQLLGEFGDNRLAPKTLVDWLYDYAHDMRQQPRPGLFLGSVHAAKGLEFRHVVVLDGGWNQRLDQLPEERRLYYVAMTRAEETLTLCAYGSDNIFTRDVAECAERRPFQGCHDPSLDVRYRLLGMQDIDLGYAGRQSEQASIHHAIREARPGDALRLDFSGDRYLIRDRQGRILGRTAKAFHLDWKPAHCEVEAIVTRYAEDGEESYRNAMRCASWEVVLPRIKSHPLAAKQAV